MLAKVFPKKHGRWKTAEPVEERLHDGGYLKRIVRGCKDDSVRRHHLLDEHIPVVLQRTVLLALPEAHPAASASLEPIVAQAHDFVLDIASDGEDVQDPADGIICILLAGDPINADFLHGGTFALSMGLSFIAQLDALRPFFHKVVLNNCSLFCSHISKVIVGAPKMPLSLAGLLLLSPTFSK
jgi:hypothetical protein